MWALILTAVLSAGPQMEARTLDDRAVQGTLVELSADRVVLETPSGRETIEIRNLLTLVPVADVARTGEDAKIRVELVDGTSIPLGEYRVKDGTAELTFPSGQSAHLPTRSVAAVRFNQQSDEVREQWKEILEASTVGDVLVIRKGDSLDYLEGVLGDMAEDVLQFTLGDMLLSVKRKKIEGIIYAHPAGRRLPPALCVVVDDVGAKIPAHAIELVGGVIRFTSPAGLELRRSPARIVRLDFSRGKVQYLSELTPEAVNWTPYFGSAGATSVQRQFFRHRTDRGLRAPSLRLGGKSYDRGLALHSRTELVYRLDGRWRLFKALAGIDDLVQGKGNVRLVLRGDDRVLWESTVTGEDDPRQLVLDVSGVKRLTILVDFGDDLDVADHLNLCEARIIK